MRNEDLVPLFNPAATPVPVTGGSSGQTFRQGTVLTWNASTGENTVDVGGVVMQNLSVLAAESVALVVGDVVRIDASGKSWFIAGRVSIPGAEVVPTWQADITELNEVTLPALQSELDVAEADIATLTDTTIPALQVEVDAAEADIVTIETVTLPALQAEVDGILPITETDISDDAITTPKIAANAVTAAEINAGAVTTAKLDAGAVTAIKIAANTITAAEIAASAITASELAANAVTAGKIAAGTIVAADISSGAVTTAKLAANAVTANEIAAGAITATKLSADAIDGKTITGALIRTAATAPRIEIGQGSGPNEIRFYSGDVNETAPGELAVSPSEFFLASPMISGERALIELTTAGGPQVDLIGDFVVMENDAGVGVSVNNGVLSRIGQVWHTVGGAGEPGFVNGWTAVVGYPPQFMIDALGNVHMRGSVTPGTHQTTAFTLPVGYRPSASGPLALTFITAANGGQGWSKVDVFPSGAVRVWTAGFTGAPVVGNVSLQCIFPTA